MNVHSLVLHGSSILWHHHREADRRQTGLSSASQPAHYFEDGGPAFKQASGDDDVRLDCLAGGQSSEQHVQRLSAAPRQAGANMGKTEL